MQRRRLGRAFGTFAATSAILAIPMVSAQAYDPTGGTMYQLGSDPCLKGRGNCAVYPKSAELPSGRLVASFEKSTVVTATGSADRQTLPVYKSDDHGTTWQALSEVKAPAYLSSDPQYAKYTSNWTNPYLYTLPQDVGNLKQGTLLLAGVVSGDDYYYKEHKAADPNWTPTNDGDRKDLAIALYSSTDEGATWKVVNVIATGGWQGGSAGAVGQNIAAANTNSQVDPIWEPYLMVYKGQLVCYYSDENDYTGFNATTGVPTLDPANDTATDSHGQILAHKTWDGAAAAWSAPVVDVAGLTQNMGGGKTEIGGGRPGMANVVRTTDGKWLLTFEYWGGGVNTKYVLADNPLKFYTGSPTGTGVTTLPLDSGSHPSRRTAVRSSSGCPAGAWSTTRPAAATSGSTTAGAATARGRSTRPPRRPATAATCSTSRPPAASRSSTTRAPPRSPTPRSTSATRTAPTTSWSTARPTR